MKEKSTPRGSRGIHYPYGRDATRHIYIKQSPQSAAAAAEPIGPEERAPILPPPELPTPPSEGERDAEYEEYLRENPASGLLKVQAYRAREAIPQSNVGVRVSTYIGNREQIFFEGATDGNGIIDNIKLPAPPRDNSLRFGDSHPSATYLLSASEDGFIPITVGITIFDGVKTIQPLPMIIQGR